MKKMKRIISIVGIILLLTMYASTLIFAIIDHSKSQGLLKASIACTIFVPVLLYAFTLFSRLFSSDDNTDHTEPPSE